jgi:hypothetical protein
VSTRRFIKPVTNAVAPLQKNFHHRREHPDKSAGKSKTKSIEFYERLPVSKSQAPTINQFAATQSQQVGNLSAVIIAFGVWVYVLASRIPPDANANVHVLASVGPAVEVSCERN